MKKPERKDKDPYESVNRRLDALIRITAETLFISNDRKIGEADVIRMLNSAGLTPTEIAKIMGRKDRRSVSGELYGSKKDE